MILTSLKTHVQMVAINAPLWPSATPTYTYTGQNTNSYDLQVVKDGVASTLTIDMNTYKGQSLVVYTVPLPNGTKKNMAMLQGFTQYAIFMDPAESNGRSDRL